MRISERFSHFTRPENATALAGYALALAGPPASAWVRWELGGIVGEELPVYLTFYPVIILSSLLGGTTAGLVSTLFAGGLVSYYFLDPPGAFGINTPTDLAGMALFTLVNLMISLVGGNLRKAHLRTGAQARQLEKTVDLLNADITARKEAEGALRESEQRYRRLFEVIDEGFCVLQILFDDQGRPNNWLYLEVNPAFARHNGLQDATGKTILELAPNIEARWMEIYGRVAVEGEPIRFVEASPALHRWFDLYAFRVGEPEERKVAVLFTNITARKAVEEDLVQARHELASINTKLEQQVNDRTADLRATVMELEHFSYMITHDMRAPLRAMSGFAGILRETCSASLQPTDRDYLNRIADAAERMDRLITDALQFTGVLRQRFDLEPVDAGSLLRGILASYPQFQPPHAIIHLDGDLPLVLGNKAALTLCCSNFIGNAVKFTKPHTVPQVRIWAETSIPIAGETPAVRVCFEDRGIGIEPHYLDRIWGMFQRLDKHYEGTGVGLALVRKAVERMGGRVGVESQPGHGSRFWLELPAADLA